MSIYATGKAQLEKWDGDRKELEKIEGQVLTEITKRTLPNEMLPPDLLRP